MERLPLEITMEALSREPEGSYLLADMRSAQERERGGIPGAIALSPQEVESWCPEVKQPDAPSPALVRGSQPGVLAPEGHLSLPQPPPHTCSSSLK